MILYQYDQKKPGYTLKETGKKNARTGEFRLTYDSPYQTGIEVNDTVHVKLFLNKDKVYKKIHNLNNIDIKDSGNNNNDDDDDDDDNNNNILILVHGFSTGKRKLKNYYHFINKMNSDNLSCAFINLPFHLKRTPEGEKSGDRLTHFNDAETLLFFHQCVVDIKKLIDILLKITGAKNIYICGMSLGSMISLVAMANDNRIDKGIFLIGGGNWEEIHWRGMLRFILKGNCIYKDKKYKNKTRRDACSEIYSGFPDFLKRFKELKYNNIKMDPEAMPELKKVITKMCFLCDPLAFAHKIKPEKILMINSNLDFYFSRTSTYQLWEELGKPKIYWLNKLHSSKILTNKKIIMKIKNFLTDN